MANEQKGKKCAHPNCSCIVSGHDKYCSDYCKEAKGMMEIHCGCEHAGCK